ncbi:MAG: chromosome segregation protein SMC [Peptococcaceae bacterium]|nr:chromosome segregation protein SMC [Peptococcaceae bacterium]MDH7525460.1 chromosome segregation protein SMC [Peptococcaceae bacterium]
MYLKKLEIHGFKSFADKTVLEFKPGITLVVGPNGSGKSNIADAVRWVLGEQSVKSLRGGKMEDVIFAGSEKRRSLGMAEVSLTLDNSSGLFPLEFNEITVTRRLYRSGESDYLINRVPCRLRDIHELFMDTGIGKEGISIIGQGKVDEILSVRPEERRGLLEEAAGIVKYRHRKREAAKKLEETEASLVRLRDIVSELESQEEPLAEQAKTALLYRDMKSELDGLEIGMLVDEMETCRRRLESIGRSRQNEEKEIEQARTEYYEALSKEEKYKLLLQKQEENLAVQQESIYEENLRLEKNESEMKLAAERISDLVQQAKNYGGEIRKLNEELESMKSDCEHHKAAGEALGKSLEEAREKLRQYEDYLSGDSLEEQGLAQRLDELKTEHFEFLQEETRINNEINSVKQRLSLLERHEEQLRDKEKQLVSGLDSIKNRADELESEAGEFSARQLFLEKQLAESEMHYREEEKKYKQIQQRIRGLLDEKNSIAARQRVFSEMEREGQGYGQGVREILLQKARGGFEQIVGTVAQVISVPKEYELAVEVALGSALQHLIAENEDAAEKAVEWLKNNDKGRATFLPLTTVKGTTAAEKPPQEEGVVGLLSEIVQYEKRFKGIMDFLLGRVWLIKDLSTAIKQARAIGFRCRMVTLDGQLVNTGGSITGGSVKANASGILSRKRAVGELESAIEMLRQEIEQAEKEAEEQAAVVAASEERIAKLKADLQELIIKKTENLKTQERWKADHERCQTELETVRWQLAETTEEKAGFQKSINEAEERSNELKKLIVEINNELLTLQDEVKKKQSERLKKNEKLTQLRIEAATIEEKMASFQKENSYLSNRLKQIKQHKEEKETVQAELKEKKMELEKTLNSLEYEKERILLSLREKEKQLEKMKAKKYQLQEELSRIEREAKEKSAWMKEKEEKLHQYELQQSKYETSLEAVASRLNEQYGLTCEEAKEKSTSILDKRSSQQRISWLKEEISALGQVNTGAIEEYGRLKERLDFLTGQINDMTGAKERLEQVIKEMDQIMTRRFKETFALVDKYFQEMFSRLFGGGRAQLLLTDAESLLEAGVEIVVQPPGKKSQHLSLLSGGEKSLTAIALLMAVLKVKPSPFCVLDEIESNLDESNVAGFAQLLKEFSTDTQFIVISHRKGTMEIAHVLYGVTIEETGVSSLVSVKLEDAKKEAS